MLRLRHQLDLTRLEQKKYLLKSTALRQVFAVHAVDSLDEQASTYDQIMKSNHRDQWRKAMNEEMKSIKD